MSDGKKREKKWKKEEVKEVILRYLAEKGEATKYQIQKELRIPLSTVLQAMKDLENEKLIEYEIGKRESHICRLTINGLLHCLNKGTIDLEKAKNALLEILETNGITKNEIIKKLNISEKALSCFLKVSILYFLRLKELEKVTYTDKATIEKFVKLIENPNSLISWLIGEYLYSSASLGILNLTFHDEFPFYPICHEGVKEFLKWMSNKIDWRVFLSLDRFRQYVLTQRGEKWVIDRWINLGCLFIKLKFKLKWEDLVELLKNGKCNIKLEVENSFMVGGKTCLLDGKECMVKNIRSCEKIKKFYELGDFDIYKEVIE